LCLLITGKSNAVRTALIHTAGLIEDIFKHNADGIGVMYVTSKGLKVSKTLPNSAAEAVVFLRKLPMDDREVAIHFRWRTHGDINLEQCHPYPVNATTALMHNGVLDQGNDGDRTKSDTWHFIEDYMKTMSPDAMHDAGFVKLLGEFVGNNRFAIMSGDGRLSVVNADQGISHGEVWFSNTYAWEPSLFIPTYRKPAPKPYQYSGFKSYPKSSWATGGTHGVTDLWDDYDTRDEGIYGGLQDPDDIGSLDVAVAVDTAVEDMDVETLTELLEAFPLETLRHVVTHYDVTEYANASDEDLTPAVRLVRDELISGDLVGLMTRLEADQMGVVSDRIASTLTWFCTVDYKLEELV
jgi:hypothetical protein